MRFRLQACSAWRRNARGRLRPARCTGPRKACSWSPTCIWKKVQLCARGQLLPPYDTAETLARLAKLVARFAPRTVIGSATTSTTAMARHGFAISTGVAWRAAARARLGVDRRHHDPEPAENIGGTFAAILRLGTLTFRHAPSRKCADGEIAGHLHPVARIAQRGRAVSRRCFATDGRALVMPAFGAFTGGSISVTAPSRRCSACALFTAHMLGDGKLYAFTRRAACRIDYAAARGSVAWQNSARTSASLRVAALASAAAQRASSVFRSPEPVLRSSMRWSARIATSGRTPIPRPAETAACSPVRFGLENAICQESPAASSA